MAELRRTPARVAALLVPLVLLAPATAHAEKVVLDDAVGDAELVTTSLPLDEPTVRTTEPAPDETAVDITRGVVAHGDTRLRITVHLRDLVLSSEYTAPVRIVTPQGQYWVLAGKNPGSRAQAVLTKRGLETDCRALRAALSGTAHTITVSLPTACIGAPRWVQVGVGVSRPVEPGPTSAHPSEYALFLDDGHRDGAHKHNLALGPKVRRG